MKPDHRGIPLAYTPDGPIWEDDLDVTPRERIRQIVGVLIAFAVVIAFVLIVSLPGQ